MRGSDVDNGAQRVSVGFVRFMCGSKKMCGNTVCVSPPPRASSLVRFSPALRDSIHSIRLIRSDRSYRGTTVAPGGGAPRNGPWSLGCWVGCCMEGFCIVGCCIGGCWNAGNPTKGVASGRRACSLLGITT